MIVLTGGHVVLPNCILTDASVVIDGSDIVEVNSRSHVDPADAERIDIAGGYVVPGFVDVHVHGVAGYDTLDGGDAVREIARRLPRYGVTAFCPTTVACGPDDLRAFCDQVRRARIAGVDRGARVLPAHLESNFINPEFRGAQPAHCLRAPGAVLPAAPAASSSSEFTATDILAVIAMARADVGIVTVAPEIAGGLDLVRALAGAGHRVSLGHSGADFDTAVAAIEAGARHATHLFNRMPPVTHRAPGLAGAILAHDEVAAELICDGYHVHPAMCRVAIAAKGIGGIIAITDGTGGSGLPVGSAARLGGRPIHIREQAAFLDDGTLAGSTLTMDRAFRNIVGLMGGSIVDAAMLCSTTPARHLGMIGLGVIAAGATADVAVLDSTLHVTHTFIDGQQVFPA